MLGSPTFLRGLAAAGRGVGLQVSSTFATGPRQGDGTFYEFRTYTVKPDKMKDFLELTGKNIHLRTAHSPVVGYWTLEVGGLNKAFSIWKYEQLSLIVIVTPDRPRVLPEVNFWQLSGQLWDQEWQEKYMSRMLPLLNKQKNEIAYLVPWCDLGSSPNDGVYELVTFQMKPGGPSVWGQSFKGAVNAHIKTGYSKLIGVFHTEYGLLNRVHVLWWNENPDSRAAGRHHAHEDPRVVAAVRESVQFLESQKNLLLLPTGFSPLK
ncbi:protein NipSnap homolog 3A-like [Sphaerodactylus townsendi]|uniref:protein NipSnap homolog 3A-like n=1 Tax=Sphaerodactylus townsendi TaxID=933632 RepID=UPI002026A0E6|nr:protein NipSnap homolog 3A-like [Sphaerodactylus townsendi]